MRRKVSCVLRTCVLVVGVFLFATTGSYSEKREVEIWMFKTFVPPANEYQSKLMQEFERKTGYKVKGQLVSWDDMGPKLIPTIEAGTPPDLAHVMFPLKWQGIGAVVSLNDLYKELGEKYGGWVPIAESAVNAEGHTWGIPYQTSPEVFYVRKDRFEAAGLDYPKTWKEFRNVCLKLNDPGRLVYAFGQAYGGESYDVNKSLRMCLWSFGGHLTEKDGRTLAIDSPETREAMEFWADLYGKYKVVPPGATGWTGSSNNIAFENGFATMVINTGSIIWSMRAGNPELLEKTALIPPLRGPVEAAGYTGANAFVIPKNAKNLEAAKEFVRFFFEKENYEGYLQAGGAMDVPVLMDFSKMPMWNDPINKVFMDTVVAAHTVGYPGAPTPKAHRIFNDKYIENLLVGNLLQGWDYDAAMSTLLEQLEKIYQE